MLRTVLAFVGLGLVVLTLVGMAGVAVLRRIAVDQSVGDAQQLAALSARIVQPRVEDGLVSASDPEAQVRVAAIVGDAVLHDPVVAVRVWRADGMIVYSDQAAQIGRRFSTGVTVLDSLPPGEVLTRIGDRTQPENAYLPQGTRLLESFVRIETPDHTPLLFEVSQPFSKVIESQHRLLRAFTPVLEVALFALGMLLIPLAWALARRVQRASVEREELLRRAIDVSDRERRRIAGDLHDGPVQELTGLALQLSAQATLAKSPDEFAALHDAAGAVRGSIRTLRSAVVGIYPPNLQASGLGPALSDLTARLPREGVAIDLEVADPGGYGPEADELLYRACAEALRNVEAHAEARSVSVDVRRRGGRAVLEVRDDGRGVGVDDPLTAKRAGHFGLQILRDVLRDGGGELVVQPGDHGGTLLRAEVPVG